MNDSAPIPGTTVSGPVPFAKGHGTENDFVIVPDPDGVLEIPPQLVRALCDRRAGIGADGLLRVVRTIRLPEGLGLDGEWFMDYRNGDGSIAEMCGNGIRVFARYLVEANLAKAGTMRIATRAGTKLIVVPDGQSDITVDMGPAVIGSEAVVQVGGRSFAGIAVSMGNPHLVCGTALPVAGLDLTSPPEFDPAMFRTGVNVEIVNVLAGDARTTPGVPAPDGYDLRVRMRVYERGSGETQSCGTGACAVGAVALRSAGKTTGRVAVDVPGGRVAVTVTTATTLLEGPAVLVAGGQLSPEWLARAVAPERVSAGPAPEPEAPRALLGEVVPPAAAPAETPPARVATAPARSVSPVGPVPSVDPVSPAAPARPTSPAPPVRPARSSRRDPVTAGETTGSWNTIAPAGMVAGEPVVTPGLGALLAAVTAPVTAAIAEESADEQPAGGQHAAQRQTVLGRPPHGPPAGTPGEPAAVGPRA